MPRPSSETTRLVSLLFVIGRRMRDGSRNAAHAGFSLLHFETLRYIKGHGRPLMHDLAAHLLITPPAATVLVDGFVKHGLVARELDRKDRRAVKLAITKKGEALFEKQIKRKMREMKKVFSVLSAKEQRQLAKILSKVAKKAP